MVSRLLGVGARLMRYSCLGAWAGCYAVARVFSVVVVAYAVAKIFLLVAKVMLGGS